MVSGGDLTVDNLLEQNRLYSTEVVALFETKNNSRKYRYLKRRLGMSCMYAIEPRGIAGGMCVFWRDANDLVLVKYGDFFIEVLIEDGVRHFKWRSVVVYACTDERKRTQQFEVLLTRLAGYTEPCLLMGDFNDLLLDSEKDRENDRSVASMRAFRNFVAYASLLDLGFEGYSYTWRNIQEEGFIQERLDCALATHDWVQSYQQAIVKHMELEGSDHVMLVLSTEVNQPRHLMHNLRKVKHRLVTWQKNEGHNEQKEICRLKEVLRVAYQQSVFDGNWILGLEEELTRAFRREEIVWRTKS
ncbi:uncharacterized protein LOC126618176 [Malus sylvestris]|uniref:uncharacterized protein LOC126618176 n=1 Tax=Malus sylvestris TaxID=3752 RepID=UPI0021AC9064|nr:uncharacterized protein LOC126618176 [Malus sylvestris]